MAHGARTKRDFVLLQGAFYGGARGVPKVLDHMIEHGETGQRCEPFSAWAGRSKRFRDRVHASGEGTNRAG
jgi:hypothetical protein